MYCFVEMTPLATSARIGLPTPVNQRLQILLFHLASCCVGWWTLGWGFSLSAAGYLESLGRLNGVTYYAAVLDGPCAGIAIGLLFGASTLPSFTNLLRAPLPTAETRNGRTEGTLIVNLPPVALCLLFGVTFGGIAGLGFAFRHAPDLWISGVVGGGIFGIASVFLMSPTALLIAKQKVGMRTGREFVILTAAGLISFGCVGYLLLLLRNTAGL